MKKKKAKDCIRLLKEENEMMRDTLSRAQNSVEYWGTVHRNQCLKFDFAVSVLEDQIFDLEDEILELKTIQTKEEQVQSLAEYEEMDQGQSKGKC